MHSYNASQRIFSGAKEVEKTTEIFRFFGQDLFLKKGSFEWEFGNVSAFRKEIKNLHEQTDRGIYSGYFAMKPII